MTTEKYRIGIIDEDSGDRRMFEENFHDEFDVVVLDLKDDANSTIQEIFEQDVDVVAIDYLLTENKSGLNYNGDTLFNELEKHIPQFPFFILSNRPDDASLTTEDQFRIVNKSIYLHENEAQLEDLKSKLKQQAKIFKSKVEKAMVTLQELSRIPSNIITPEQEQKKFEVEDFLDGANGNFHRTDFATRSNRAIGKLDDLINKLDSLIQNNSPKE